MEVEKEITPRIMFHIFKIPVTDTVTTTWLLMAVLTVLAYFVSRNLKEKPSSWQNIIELGVESIYNLIKSMIGVGTETFLPLVGTLAIFIGMANLLSIVPYFSPPTRDINTPLALALIVFLAVHYYGLTRQGLKYLEHYVSPTPVLLPIHIISEISRTFSLTIRLFGNIMGEEIIIAIFAILAPIIVPIPMMAFSIFTGILQAFIFSILTIIYLAGAVTAGHV